MISLSSIIFAYWGAKLAAALVALTVWTAKLVDLRRQKRVPKALQHHSYGMRASMAKAGEDMRPAPIMSGKKQERVAVYRDVAPTIKTGGTLKFMGRAFHSYIIRFAEFGDASHIAQTEVDEDGEIWILQSIEGQGVVRCKLGDEVKKYPGQWAYADVIPELEEKYNRAAAHKAAMKLVNSKAHYGYAGIVLQIATHSPLLCPLAYMLRINQWKIFSKWPFCSQMRADTFRVGGIDPCHGRDSCLIGPQDINETAVLTEWVTIMPDEVAIAA